jgi:biopolymer transport protein ExbB
MSLISRTTQHRTLSSVLIAVGLLLPALAFAETQPSTGVLLNLPRDLSPWGMFLAADIVVRTVMVGLAFASVLTWTIWFAKAIELMIARRRMRAAIDALSGARSWSEASAVSQGRNDGTAAMIGAADSELRLSADAMSADGVKERIASR